MPTAKTRQMQMAEIIKSMTYDDLMEVDQWFRDVVSDHVEGGMAECDRQGYWASVLNDWAEAALEKSKHRSNNP